MGTDLSVVNAARVSFNKKSLSGQKNIPGQGIFELSNGDKKLIQYLAKTRTLDAIWTLYIIISHQGTNICCPSVGQTSGGSGME